MSSKTRAQLATEIAANFPDNTSGSITPAILRTTVTDIVAAAPNLADEGTPIPKSQLFVLATFVFNGAGSAPLAMTSTNSKPIPAACIVTGYTITSDTVGSCVVDIQKATGGGSFSSIVASAPPTLSSASYLDSSTLTGWTTNWSAHDCAKAVITSASGVTIIVVTIYGTIA